MEDQVFIQHRFTITEDDKTYSDAIVLPIDEYNALTSKQIETLKQDRFDNWKTAISTPPPEVDPDVAIDDIQAQIDTLQEQKTSYVAEKEAKNREDGA